MRLFLGTFLGQDNQDYFGGLVGDLVRAHGDVLRAIPARTAHVTYVFCADAGDKLSGGGPAAAPSELVDVIRAVAGRHAPVDVRVGSPHLISAGSLPRLLAASILTGTDG